MSDKTRYEGIVTATTADGVRVRILESSACEGCKAKAVCNSSERKEKFIEAALPPYSPGAYTVGDRVRITVSTALGMKAVWLGFGLPLALLVAGMVVAASLLSDESAAALAGIGVLVPYYVLLWLLKPKLRNEFRFVLED